MGSARLATVLTLIFDEAIGTDSQALTLVKEKKFVDST